MSKITAVASASATVEAYPNERAPAPLHYLEKLQSAFSAEAQRKEVELERFESVDSVIGELCPSEPVFCINPATLRLEAQRFASFPGRSLYAVKCNPHPFVLRTLFEAGITDFDVASLREVELIDGLFEGRAGQFFNNPAKSRQAIRISSERYGIRFYTVDSLNEIDKVLSEADRGQDLMVAVRLATRPRAARYVLSTKFGATPDDAVAILRKIHSAGVQTGVSFHVGSQCLSPVAFSEAMQLVGRVARRAGVPINVLNVGGGFPAPYPGDDVQGLDYYFSRIVHGQNGLQLPPGCLVLSEPGRRLVATAGTVILQVVMRRHDSIFVNDGVFGTLQELGHPKEHRPVRLVRSRKGRTSDAMRPFRVYGPTCDSNDVVAAPFVLPADVSEGDWIEVGMMGAYSLAMRTEFNGFHVDRVVQIGDAK